MDEISLEELAALVLKQMARRDKLITGVEIYEFTKKRLSFKEVEGGVVIKNKKFILDEKNLTSVSSAEVPEVPVQSVQHPPVQWVKQSDNLNISRYEIFNPNSSDLPLLQRQGYNLTIRKRYPIIRELTNMTKAVVDGIATEIPSIDYETLDDMGNKVKVPSMHFVPESKGLIGQRMLNEVESARRGGGKLLYQTPHDVQMPVLRRGF